MRTLGGASCLSPCLAVSQLNICGKIVHLIAVAHCAERPMYENFEIRAVAVGLL